MASPQADHGGMSVVLVTVLSSFIASAVEFVEALTVVLAVGVTRQWRSTLLGVGAAIAVLIVLVAVLGLTIATLVPIELLRVVVGTVLIVYGLQWLTRAVLRAAGARANRDELASFGREVVALADEQPVPGTGVDWISFTVAFKGVLLEGLEVAFIVITFGVAGGQLVPALIGASLAGMGVLSVGAAVRRPLARLPENQLKFGVGLMLVSFGTFWAGEGIGIAWPDSDLSIVLLLVGYLATSLLAMRTVAAGLVRPRRLIPMHARQEAN
jgi:Ca2+/H+ antiporter, TMEM165/GDT1 family